MSSRLVDPASAGEQALRRGAWSEARDHFQRAVAADPDAATAWEGLGWAAWWLSDEALTREATERGFRAHRAADDVAGAARAAIWLASSHLNFRGDDAVAAGWLERARRLLDGRPVSPEHGYLALVEGDLLAMTPSDPAEAERV